MDRFGATRSAGGISISPYDLLLISEMVRNHGANKNGQIVPENWIDDIKKYKDNSMLFKSRQIGKVS